MSEPYTEERYLLDQLADLRRSYELSAKPYIDRLAQLRAIQSPSLPVMTLQQARQFINSQVPTIDTTGSQP